MNSTSIEVELGVDICKRLKKIYFNDQEWINCYKDIAQLFSKIKKIARNFFIEEDIIQILKRLQKFSDEDLKELQETN